MPHIQFPKSSSIFCSKTLSDIRKNAVVDGRRKILQTYLNEIAEISAVRACPKFNQFVELKNETETSINTDSHIGASLDEIFVNYSSTTSKHSFVLVCIPVLKYFLLWSN